jgi:hypothetical protein
MVVMPHLTSTTPSMFNRLRENMKSISKLAQEHTGIGRFGWDPSHQTLSFDGVPIPMNLFVKSIHQVIDRLGKLVAQVFRRTSYTDILKYIDTRLDPANSINWFRDRPQQFSIGTSIFNESDNRFERYRHILLSDMVQDDHFFAYQGKVLPKLGAYFQYIFLFSSLTHTLCSQHARMASEP